jgi:hypothetical protein
MERFPLAEDGDQCRALVNTYALRIMLGKLFSIFAPAASEGRTQLQEVSHLTMLCSVEC